MPIELSSRSVPMRALALSAAALAVPVVGALVMPGALGDFGALLWLAALVPAFLFAYYRGWRGVATALALGMATLSLTQAAALVRGLTVPNLLLGVVVTYVAISLGIGWLAESLHKERALVEDMAFTDLLTRLPNRRHARIFLENEFAAAERGRQLSVVLFDLDHFKVFNDEHGHPAGDVALSRFGSILEETTRRMDLSARFGGEEFISILTSTDTEGALIFADRIRAALAETRLQPSGRLTVSAGVATYHPSVRSPDELLAAADHALYQAKRDGRNRVRLFGHALMDHAMPSADAQELLELMGREPEDYPRPSEEIGRSKPPLTLLPHQITGFGKERRALVVEDDPQVRSLVTNYLQREGFHVDHASDVPSGIDAIHREYDTIITDLRLPGPPGTELVSAVKSRWPFTQVLVMTGLHDAKVAAEALSAGADRYLFKPFGMPDLRRHLVDSLNRRDQLLGQRARDADAPGPAGERARIAREETVEALEALVRAAEARDPHSRGHGARVAARAELLADVLDPSGTEVDREALRLGSRLVDVGKLGVPDAVLNKPDRLDSHERRQAEQHASVGKQLLQPLLHEDTVLSVVSWHHERWDGKGYPDGLRGTTIPLAARIVAVADGLAAMTQSRPWREAMDFDEAVVEVRGFAGLRYDPGVVTAMDACLDELRALGANESAA